MLNAARIDAEVGTSPRIAGRCRSCSVVRSNETWSKRVELTVPGRVDGLMTTVLMSQLESSAVRQFWPPTPPFPSSQVMKMTVLPET